MHRSVAMYVGGILYPAIGNASRAFVGLIAVACLFVKQHQPADISPGLALGRAAWLTAPTF